MYTAATALLLLCGSSGGLCSAPHDILVDLDGRISDLEAPESVPGADFEAASSSNWVNIRTFCDPTCLDTNRAQKPLRRSQTAPAADLMSLEGRKITRSKTAPELCDDECQHQKTAKMFGDGKVASGCCSRCRVHALMVAYYSASFGEAGAGEVPAISTAMSWVNTFNAVGQFGRVMMGGESSLYSQLQDRLKAQDTKWYNKFYESIGAWTSTVVDGAGAVGGMFGLKEFPGVSTLFGANKAAYATAHKNRMSTLKCGTAQEWPASAPPDPSAALKSAPKPAFDQLKDKTGKATSLASFLSNAAVPAEEILKALK